MNVALVDREEDVLGSVNCGSRESPGEVEEQGIGSQLRRVEDAGLENCSREFMVLILFERFGADDLWAR